MVLNRNKYDCHSSVECITQHNRIIKQQIILYCCNSIRNLSIFILESGWWSEWVREKSRANKLQRDRNIARNDASTTTIRADTIKTLKQNENDNRHTLVDVVAMMKTATSKSQPAPHYQPYTVNFVLYSIPNLSISLSLHLYFCHLLALHTDIYTLSSQTLGSIIATCSILSTWLTYRTMQCHMNNVWLVQKYFRWHKNNNNIADKSQKKRRRWDKTYSLHSWSASHNEKTPTQKTTQAAKWYGWRIGKSTTTSTRSK